MAAQVNEPRQTAVEDDRTSTEAPLRVPWGVPAVLAGLALPLLIWGSSFAYSISTDAKKELSDADVAAGIITTIFLLDGALVGIPAIVALWRHRVGWQTLGFRPLDSRLWWWPLAAAASAYVCVIIYGIIATSIVGDPPDQNLDELFHSRAILPLAGFSLVIVAPLAEETFFRGFVFPGLLRSLGPAGAMAASGLLFGMFHIQDAGTVALVLPFGAIGALFAWLYYKTGSLWTSIATHMLFNSVSFAILASTAD